MKRLLVTICIYLATCAAASLLLVESILRMQPIDAFAVGSIAGSTFGLIFTFLFALRHQGLLADMLDYLDELIHGRAP